MIKVILLGDSITQWNPLRGNGILNLGLAGDTTRDIWWRIEEVLKIDCDKVILMVGINDILMGIPLDKSDEFYKKIVMELKNDLKKVTIISILPICGNEKNNIRIRKLNSVIKKIADKSDVSYIDLTKFFIDEKGGMREGFSTDGIHLSRSGYEVLNSQLLKLI